MSLPKKWFDASCEELFPKFGHCDRHVRVETAGEPIASHSDVFHLLRAKGRGWVLLVSRQYVELCWSQDSTLSFLCASFTQLCHTLSFTQLSHAPSFFVTHHLSHALSHTTLHIRLFYFSILHHLLCLSFPVPATTFVAHYRKKLTCGAIRSLNFCLQL